MRRKKGVMYQVYEAFGDHRSAPVWARIARIPYETFRRYLYQGYTVEEIFKKHGVRYQPETPPKE